MLVCEGDCEDFKIGMPQIESALIMASPHIHSWGVEYTGKQFKFCPWCGRILVEKEKEI